MQITKTTPILYLIILSFMLALIACQADMENASYADYSDDGIQNEQPLMNKESVKQMEEAMKGKYIIREGHISIQVEDYQKSREALVELVAKKGGYISKEQELSLIHI